MKIKATLGYCVQKLKRWPQYHNKTASTSNHAIAKSLNSILISSRAKAEAAAHFLAPLKKRTGEHFGRSPCPCYHDLTDDRREDYRQSIRPYNHSL